MAKTMTSKTLTMTQPDGWVVAWRTHMKRTGRKNLSQFVAECVNNTIEQEFSQSGKKSPVKGVRGSQGRRLAVDGS